jgi:hypothetical protein
LAAGQNKHPVAKVGGSACLTLSTHCKGRGHAKANSVVNPSGVLQMAGCLLWPTSPHLSRPEPLQQAHGKIKCRNVHRENGQLSSCCLYNGLHAREAVFVPATVLCPPLLCRMHS